MQFERECVTAIILYMSSYDETAQTKIVIYA